MKNSEIAVAANGEMYTGVEIAATEKWCLPEILKFQICFYFRLEGTKVFLTVVGTGPWPFSETRVELELNSNVEFEISLFKILELKIGVRDWKIENRNVCFNMYASVCALNQCLSRQQGFCLKPPTKNAAFTEDDAFKAMVVHMLMDKDAASAAKCNCAHS